MIDLELAFAEEYFSPQFPNFWRWAEPGCCEIEGAWPNSTLIAFREEVVQILAELQPQGWPPFSSILLVCAAARDCWPEHRTWISAVMIDTQSGRARFVSQLMEGLERVYALPKRLRDSTEAKIDIIRIVFEGGHRTLTPDKAAVGLRYLQTIVPFRDPDSWPALRHDMTSVQFAWTTRGLRIGLTNLSEQTLESRVKTGIDQQLSPATVNLTDDAATFSTRLAQWTTDPELYAIARIARQLIPILSWPRSMNEPDDLSVGGISDVANDGPLDRLLLSELAHDDDTLAVRIVQKEALYLRRESPTHPVARRRAVLVDTSLRLWGRPRAYAAAVVLALAAAQDQAPALTVSIDVVDWPAWKPVELSTRAGAMELLSCLAPVLHAAQAVGEWSRRAVLHDASCDPVLITTAETLADPEMQLAVGHLPAEFHVILIDADGQLELRRHTTRGWHTIRTARLDLDELLQPLPDTRSRSLTKSGPNRFPAFLRTDPCPLRLIHPLEGGHLWFLPGNRMLSQAPGNRLMLWDNRFKAARQISTDMPPHKAEASYSPPNKRGSVVYLLIRSATWQLLCVNLETREMHSYSLATALAPSDQTVKGVIVAESVFLVFRTGIQAFSLENGELLSEYNLIRHRSLECVGHRYLRDQDGKWQRLSFDGAIQLTPLKEHVQSMMVADVSCINTLGHGPLCLPCQQGKQIDSRTAPPFEQKQIDGIRQRESLIMLRGTFASLNGNAYPNQVTAVWDLDAPEWKWNVHYTPDFETASRNEAVLKFRPRQNLRYKFIALAYSSDHIRLRSARQWWQFELRHDRLQLVSVPAFSADTGLVSFEKRHWPGVSVPIRAAELPNGNSIWLDGRGLMHLMPADYSEPEVTLILDEDNISGWVSCGMLFGDPYYFEDGIPMADVRLAWNQHVLPFFGVTR